MFRTPVILGTIFLIFVFLAWWMNSSTIENAKKRLPIINPNDVNSELVDESVQAQGQGHTIRYFDLTDQRGRKITGTELDGKIHVVDFFFTACGGICPVMTKQMKRIQDAFANEKGVMLVSHTVTPERDSSEILKSYAEKYGANHDKWLFLTGNKNEIYGLARRAYFIVRKAKEGEDDGSGGDFIHTENFVLIDGKKRIRGYYSGIRPTSVDSLIIDIQLLLEE